MTALLLGLWCALTGTAQAAPARLAVVISSNGGLEHEEPLQYADEDGRRVADVLVELGGFADDDVYLVGDATVEEVTRTLGEVVVKASALRDAGEPPVLMVYYTGHAGQDGLHLDGEVLPLTALKTAARVVPAAERVFVVDACQAGQLLRSKGSTLVAVSDRPSGFEPPADEAWLTSSGPEERSFEVDRRRGALFTHFFVSGARGAADSDGDRSVTLGELYDFVHRQTSAAAAGLGYVQQPRWAGTLTRFELTDLERGLSGIEAVGPVGEPLLVVRRDSATVAAEIPPGAGSRIALRPGRYQVLSMARRLRVTEVVVPSSGYSRVDVGRDLADVAGVRTKGGLVQTAPWSVGVGWTGGLGSTPAALATQGAWVSAWRALGRGHDLGLGVAVSAGRFDETWFAGTERQVEGMVRYRADLVLGRARLGPGLNLRAGELVQTGARSDAGPWGRWYGDAAAEHRARVGSGAFEAALAIGVPAGGLMLDGWLSGGLAGTFGAPISIRPTGTAVVGVEVPL